MKNSDQPAFPPTRELCEISKIETYPYGLTKREYFAAKAMQGILAEKKTIEKIEFNHVSKKAVELADSLLSALEKQITQTEKSNVGKGWEGITTIDDVWDDLVYRLVITKEERERVRKLTHSEQQSELDKYKQFRRKHY